MRTYEANHHNATASERNRLHLESKEWSAQLFGYLVSCQWVRVSCHEAHRCFSKPPVWALQLASLNKQPGSNTNWPSPTFKPAQHNIQHIVYDRPQWGFLTIHRHCGGENNKKTEYFVSCNYSPIIWSKYVITGTLLSRMSGFDQVVAQCVSH